MRCTWWIMVCAWKCPSRFSHRRQEQAGAGAGAGVPIPVPVPVLRHTYEPKLRVRLAAAIYQEALHCYCHVHAYSTNTVHRCICSHLACLESTARSFSTRPDAAQYIQVVKRRPQLLSTRLAELKEDRHQSLTFALHAPAVPHPHLPRSPLLPLGLSLA